ncbi:MAG TPA: Sec-independent protein translocase subunit TatA [Streptosporangiaceae bacterium]|jgi:sec-independent protein translocase protein TatA
MGSLQPWHIILVVVVAIVLFGSKRLPDATRSIGRSLRIFKAETKGVMSDEDGNPVDQQQQQQYTAQAQPPQAQPQSPPQQPAQAQQLPPGDGTTINGVPLGSQQPTQPQGPQNPS